MNTALAIPAISNVSFHHYLALPHNFPRRQLRQRRIMNTASIDRNISSRWSHGRIQHPFGIVVWSGITMATEINSRSIYLTYKFHRDGPTAAFNIHLENVLWSQWQVCCAPHDGESPPCYFSTVTCTLCIFSLGVPFIPLIISLMGAQLIFMPRLLVAL